MNWRARARAAATPVRVLIAVIGISIFWRTFRLRQPGSSVIFDETYYVNAVRVLLGWDVKPGTAYAGSPTGMDPNHEHPPLGKVLIAGSMKVFGDDPLGWRLPSIVAGVAAIVLLYLIVRAASGDAWLGVLAATIFAFDNLVLVHSRIATLDMMSVAFLLLGAWLWMLRRPFLAGAACALAALVKLPGVYGFAALAALAIGSVVVRRVRDGTWGRAELRAAALLGAGFAGVWILGLWALDLAFTPYDTPWAHVRYMLDYGFSLHGAPVNSESRPWQWLANRVQVPYFVVDTTVTAGDVSKTRTVIDFKGAMNPVVIGALGLGISYSAWHAWRFRDRLSFWVLAWFAGTYLLYYPLVLLSGRTTYLFYFLPALPAVAVAIAQLLRQSGLPRLVTWGYLTALAIGFLEYYPFRRIL